MSLIRKLKSKNNKINIHQSFDGELGSTVWDCALVLLKYLENKDDFPTDFFKGKRVIELGAGTGVIESQASKALVLYYSSALPTFRFLYKGAEVILTDRKPLLELMNKNIEENCVTKSCKAIEYNWGDNCSSLSPPFDVLIASDIVASAYKADFSNLIKSLDQLTNQDTLILLAYEKRSPSDLDFFKMLETNYQLTQVTKDKLDPIYSSLDIEIYRIKKELFSP
eukprot:TRINITY_DN4240_c0_g1_i4.p1 TRINITY_DN4240_c0_g1~~TRINITY_DN4240_c0_g1_i4.p1  ORF type:complete len:224 (-),score=30.23 TRINITY_DN4240_c0_g1_i4:4-675(-)